MIDQPETQVLINLVQRQPQDLDTLHNAVVEHQRKIKREEYRIWQRTVTARILSILVINGHIRRDGPDKYAAVDKPATTELVTSEQPTP